MSDSDQNVPAIAKNSKGKKPSPQRKTYPQGLLMLRINCGKGFNDEVA